MKNYNPYNYKLGGGGGGGGGSGGDDKGRPVHSHYHGIDTTTNKSGGVDGSDEGKNKGTGNEDYKKKTTNRILSRSLLFYSEDVDTDAKAASKNINQILNDIYLWLSKEKLIKKYFK